ncbi:MAG: hypothetical protein LBF88_02225 [Planctomycetaceae bacterium]|jgi:hypothetical protein|nr:hypothetical protein [Planctomycetaceae bacterium]
MDINEHKQEENQKTNIALFVLIASIVWFALGLGLVFASFNGSEAFGTATFFSSLPYFLFHVTDSRHGRMFGNNLADCFGFLEIV